MSIFNSTYEIEEINLPNEEHHEYPVKYIEIPIEIVEYVENKQITIKEAWLLAIINALIVYREEGCWASNEYLANKIQVKPRQVQHYLSSLIYLGLLNSKIIDGRRFLKPCWMFSKIQS